MERLRPRMAFPKKQQQQLERYALIFDFLAEVAPSGEGKLLSWLLDEEGEVLEVVERLKGVCDVERGMDISEYWIDSEGKRWWWR